MTAALSALLSALACATQAPVRHPPSQAPATDPEDSASEPRDGQADSGQARPYNGCGINADGQRAAGSWEEPIEAPTLPFFDRHDSSGSSTDQADAYSCDESLGEAGPEVVYRFTTELPGSFRAEVSCEEPVDIDIHLLQEPSIAGGVVSGCIARAHDSMEVEDLQAGTYWVVADSWSEDGQEFPGAYELAFEWIAEGHWNEVQLAEGVSWSRLRSADLQGGDQTVNLLRVDPGAPVDRQPHLHDGCQTVPQAAQELGALVGINAGFFGDGCAPLDLIKADGELLSVNAVTGSAQRSVGWNADGAPQLAWIDAGADWPEVSDALGSHPSLVTAGAAEVDPDSDSSFYTSRHPRSALAVTAEGALLLATVDGRTEAGDGMTTDQLASWLLEQGATEAVNLDGGGSTTLYVRDCWVGGVVNHPSDNGAADHHGERSVSDGLYLR